MVNENSIQVRSEQDVALGNMEYYLVRELETGMAIKFTRLQDEFGIERWCDLVGRLRQIRDLSPEVFQILVPSTEYSAWISKVYK